MPISTGNPSIVSLGRVAIHVFTAGVALALLALPLLDTLGGGSVARLEPPDSTSLAGTPCLRQVQEAARACLAAQERVEFADPRY